MRWLLMTTDDRAAGSSSRRRVTLFGSLHGPLMTSDDVMDCVPHQAGDALWVPTWTWHRVDYIEGVTALAASLFHVRCEQIATHPPGMQVLTTAPATLPSLRTQVRRVGTLMASEITLRLLQTHNMEICCLAPPRAFTGAA